ncbi:MAG TPA: uracil-DNA glycosylase [Nitrososphaeria archaeon]|nr:uracil-DNA glycosylase [Nitrososphaeria archaeon]
MENLRRRVQRCRRCELWKTRRNPVFGEGPANARIMLVGLGPGRQEDLQGRPFVGAAGKFLDRLLEEAGLRRDQLYITNVMKCYLPDNRASEDQVKACSPYLDQQIEIIQPELIIALGNLAASYLLGKFGLKPESMEKMHGKVYEASTLILTLRIVPMYHPASALRNPGLRDRLIEDWRELGARLRELKLI